MPNLIETITAPPRRSRRTPEQMIADLQAKIAAVKASAEGAEVSSGPVSTMSRPTRVARRALPVTSMPIGMPNSLALQIQSCIQSFSVDIVELIQRTTLDAVQRALSGVAAPDGDPTDNEPDYGRAQWQSPYDLTPARRATWQSRRDPSRALAASAGEPVSFEHYERMGLERALAESNGDVIAAGKLLGLPKSTIYRRMRNVGIPVRAGARGYTTWPDDPLVGTGEPLSLDAYERAAILRALDQCKGYMPAAARLLKVGTSTLYRRMEVLGIPRPQSARKMGLTVAART